MLLQVQEVDLQSLFLVLAVIFFLVESLIEVFSMFGNKQFKWQNGLAFVTGGFFAWFFGLDVFALLEVSPAVDIEWVVLLVGLVISGVITVRYSGLVNGAFGKFGQWVNSHKKELG